MRNQKHYSDLGLEPYTICRANMTDEEFIGAMKWSIEKYQWRSKGSMLADFQKIQVYAKWVELTLRKDIIDEDKAMYDLLQKLPKDQYRAIYTTGRGGLYVAARVAYHLDILSVHTDKHPDIDPLLVLWVDDIADSGNTIKDSPYDTAVLCKRYSCPVEPTYCGTIVTNDDYVSFTFQGEK